MARLFTAAAFALVLPLVLGACDGAHGDRGQSAGRTVFAAGPQPEPAASVPRREPLGRSIVVDVLADGEGPALMRGGTARVHYTARAAGEDAPFLSSRTAGVPLVVELGRTPLVTGLARALEGRRAGAKLVVHVPADMAWKDAPEGPVPPGTDVVFDVDVVSVR